MRIAVLAAVLVTVITIQRPCADAVARFVAGFDSPTRARDAAVPMPEPSGYVHLRPGMTDAELRDAVRRARESSQAPATHGGAPSFDAGTPLDAAASLHPAGATDRRGL